MTIQNQPRFLSTLDKFSDSGSCWKWPGCTGRNGYASAYFKGKIYAAHRLAYMLKRGPIGDGLVLDHLCRVRNCVNPWHLEAVTQRENLIRGVGAVAINIRKTSCIHGHDFTEANTIINRDGTRRCRTCARITGKKSEARRAPRIGRVRRKKPAGEGE